MAYVIDSEFCVGCGACAYECLFGVPQPTDWKKQKYTIDKEKCLGCGQCEQICPNSAISPCPDHRTILSVTIDEEKCIGCTLCKRNCPAGAPYGEVKKPFKIDETKCFRCGNCAAKCPKKAIDVVYEQA